MKYIYIYIHLLIITVSRSQNLVPNNSLETYSTCPDNASQVEYAIDWTAATDNSSTDYYNACSANVSFGVPYNNGGFQYARSGNAYAGITLYTSTEQREYLQVQLINPLAQNATYYVEFYVNLINANWSSSCNNIAANFSITKPYTSTVYQLQSLSPHIINSGNPVISDTMNWTKISGCYIAQGGEEYLTIGNFFDNANTVVTGTTGIAYYYIDDVKVEEITGTCVTGLEDMGDELGVMNIYPNPTDGMLNITTTTFRDKASMNIKLYDVLGKEVLSTIYKEEIDISNLEKGIYFLSVYQNKQLLITKKVVKE